MKLAFFSDPHLGLKRTSHTTSKSQELYRQAMFDRVMDITFNEGVQTFCLGDLFDQYSNSEDIVTQGLRIVLRCTQVLAGNHDISNRIDRPSSLASIASTLELLDRGHGIILSPDPSRPYVHGALFGRTAVYAIPHCLSQSVFEESLAIAIEQAEEDATEHRLLLLHCNVGVGFGEVERDGSPLWLTPELRDKVEAVFDRILVGHEHEPSPDLARKTVILGNTFPCGFGEISKRYIYEYDTDTGELSRECIFDPAHWYRDVHVNDLLEVDGDMQIDASLIEVTGVISARNYPAFSRALMRLWRNHPEVYAIRNAVTLDKPLDPIIRVQGELVRRTLPEIVADAVDDAGFAEEFKEVQEE